MSVRRSTGSRKSKGSRSNKSTVKRTSQAGLLSKDDPMFKKTAFAVAELPDYGAWHTRHFVISFGGFFSGFSSLEYLRRRWLAKRAGYVDKNGEVSVIDWEDGVKHPDGTKAKGSLLAKFPYSDIIMDSAMPKLTELNKKRVAEKKLKIMKSQSSVKLMPSDIQLSSSFMGDLKKQKDKAIKEATKQKDKAMKEANKLKKKAKKLY